MSDEKLNALFRVKFNGNEIKYLDTHLQKDKDIIYAALTGEYPVNKIDLFTEYFKILAEDNVLAEKTKQKTICKNTEIIDNLDYNVSANKHFLAQYKRNLATLIEIMDNCSQNHEQKDSESNLQSESSDNNPSSTL